MATESSGPLTGLRVLDAGVLFAAPLCATLLGDLGADVIKIEHPVFGDPLRSFGWQKEGEAVWWKMVGRNKQAITADLSTHAGQDIFLGLAAQSDVVLESFRPGTLERWNLSWERLRERNADLVLLRMSGFGQTGRYSQRPGFGTLAEAMSGFAAITGQPDGPPTLPSIALADGVAGLASAALVLAAIFNIHANRGHGQVIDISLIEPLFWILGPQPTVLDQLGLIQTRTGNRTAFTALRNAYETSDGKWVAISASTATIAERVLTVVGAAHLLADPRFASDNRRLENAEHLDRIVSHWIASKTRDEVLARFADAQAAAAPVYNIADIVADPYFWEREALVVAHDEELGPILMQGIIGHFSETPGRIRWPGARRGAHTDHILRERLGLDREEIQHLRDEHIV